VDLIPKPDQVVSAAGNVAYALVHGGLADLRPLPRTLIDEGLLREVYHYEPSAEVRAQGDPVLLVTPLAAPALCYDLRRGCSVVEHLVDGGRPTYLVEYGAVSFRDRDLGIGHWVADAVPAAVRAVSKHADGRPVHLVGWSLGGVFALLTAADDASLPIASVTALGTPFDVHQVPMVAPLRPLLDVTDGFGAITRLYQAAGGPPQPLVRWALGLSAFQRLVTKPLAVARHLDDADYLAQIEAVDRFIGAMTAYPGRSFGQLYHRLLRGGGLVEGTFEIGDRAIDLAAITAPVLVFAGANDAIAPIDAVHAGEMHLTGSREVRFEVVPGGHLGMLTGRRARSSTWPVLDEWLDQWAVEAPAPAAPTRRTATKAASTKPASKKAAAKKTAAEKTAATTRTTTKKATTGTTPAPTEDPPIGVNPKRRYDSASSRALRR
jgi:polyhydroxyalkanoate synthase subunit PhaC